MAAAAVLGGNMPPATDVIIPRPSASSSRIRCCLPASTNSASFPFLRSCKRSSRSRTMSSSSDFDGLDGGGEGDVSEEDEMKQWEVEMRQRLREMEDMRELEKRAEELQTRMADEEGAGEEGGEDEDEEEKRNRVRRELERLAKEQAERRETAKLMYELGQKAYGKGMYGRAIEFLEGALTIIPRTTLVGGEIQIWLAMAYDANNRHKDCIVLYQELEKQHPIVSIRRQASELRYISQAPKLKITKDEMVTIPLIGSSYDRYAGTWSDKTKKRDLAAKAGAAQSASSRDPWGNYVGWRPPTGWAKSRMLWIAITLWLAAVGVVLLLQT